MTFDEFMVFSSSLKTYYPRENLLPSKEALSLWYSALQDLPYEVLSAALQKWVTTEKWSPTIAELRTACAELVDGKLPDWGEGWYEVQKTLQRYGWNRPQEAYESLSPLAQSAAKMIGWTQICESENPEALRAQFRQCFEIAARRADEDRKLPAALKETIAGILAGHEKKQLTQ